MAATLDPNLPARFADLKREIAASVPDFEARITKAWGEIIAELSEATAQIEREGPQIVPQVSFAELATLPPAKIDEIKRRGCVVIHDVVPDEEALTWKKDLIAFAEANPTVRGIPEDDKQFFYLYWTGPQLRARSHPNVLATSSWMNNLYHTTKKDAGIDPNVALSYADRFRIRKGGVAWGFHPPHIDGGSIERWEDPAFRECFREVLSGEWRNSDAYDLDRRAGAKTSLYGRPNLGSILRTFQGWLAMSETGPREGTLQIFPDLLLSNAYITLRPFFRLKPVEARTTSDPLDAVNWEYDISSPDFPGIYVNNGGFIGPRPNDETHPHLRLDRTMTSVPKVNPGDMVFWHSDLTHSVEQEHTGTSDSSVMYIPAVPHTPANAAYVVRQLESFRNSAILPPPDMPQHEGEGHYVGHGREEDIVGELGRRAMGLAPVGA